MGRKRKIDRDQVLDAAEAIVQEHGAAALTVDAVAKAAGITKGGVQYCFGTKDQMVEALYERWAGDFACQVDKLAGSEGSAIHNMRAYVEATRQVDDAAFARSAVMMAVLLQAPSSREKYRAAYRERVDQLDLSTPEGKQAYVAFLATEGAFYLRSFGFLDIPEAEWNMVFPEIQKLLADGAGT